jgi:hypothetical protein
MGLFLLGAAAFCGWEAFHTPYGVIGAAVCWACAVLIVLALGAWYLPHLPLLRLPDERDEDRRP